MPIVRSKNPCLILNEEVIGSTTLSMEAQWIYVCACYCEKHDMLTMQELCEVARMPLQTIHGALTLLSEHDYIDYEADEDIDEQIYGIKIKP